MDVGAQLRGSREALGWSLEALAQRTRVQPRLLAAIERNDIQTLPPKPYGRGFVRAYAKEVGRDPDETVRQYFAQFAPPVSEPTGTTAPAREAARPSPAWLWLAGTGMAVAVLVAWSMGSTGSTDEPAPDAIVGTSGLSAQPASTAKDTKEPRAPEGDGDSSRGVPQTVTVLLTATRDCWVTATADGERAIFRLLRAGDRETLRGDREVVIRAGDAGALALTINGRDSGLFGSPGEVRTVQITPDNATTIR